MHLWILAMFLSLTLESSATLDSCATPKDMSRELLSSKIAIFNMSAADIPESVNWIERGAMTSVKNQGECGCCWAFATVATLESAWQIKTGNLISLSAQFFVDCDWQSRACNGTDSLSYAYYLATLRAGGIPSEDDYPFRGVKQTCRNDALPTAGFRGFERILPVEDYLLQAVAQQPVAGYIAASDELKHFKGGEIYSGSCALELNHAVVIVGYGTSDDGTKYWLIRNSWGEEWGESGYFRLIRGTGIPGGHCGINSNYSFYPFI